MVAGKMSSIETETCSNEPDFTLFLLYSHLHHVLSFIYLFLFNDM